MNSAEEFGDEIDQLREEYKNSFPELTLADYDAELATVIASDEYTFDQKLEFTLLHARAVASIRRRSPKH